jgi:MraZ protein
MLRGNYTARIDAKGRLKVPTPFRRYIDDKHGSEFYVTSLTGDNVRLYSLPEWESIEQRLSLLPSMDPARRKFLDRTNYYGQQQTMDAQGRVLIHPLLRKSAEVVGDVVVLGYLTYLEVWELDKFQKRMLADPYTEEDEAAIARLGI